MLAARSCFVALVVLLASCDGGGLPPQWGGARTGTGPRVVWDLTARPLPEIPLPNDVATFPDPGSPTGLRLNASIVAPTGIESRLRAHFDALDGWGTFAPITVSFDAPLDTDDLLARQGGIHFSAADFPRHAVYLVDLETGIPVPLDLNSGRIQHSAAEPSAYYGGDPRANESNLLFETVEEDVDHDGLLDPVEDTDGDGVLDHPNTIDGTLDGSPLETYDRMLWFYERETDTLVLRPILPLEPTHTYAIVLTDRLRGAGGTVRSPFDAPHHVSQHDALGHLPDLFAAHAELYGDLATRGWDGVAFAWSFTTQSTTGDLDALREGLYGRGPFARLATEFPARLTPAPVRGGGSRCELPNNLYTVTPAELRVALAGLPLDGLGFPAAQFDAILAQLELSVSHFAYGFFESPYLLGDPDAETVNDTWQIDRVTGAMHVERDLVPMFIVVPNETATHHQPFPVTFYAHGYGSLNLEAIAFAGLTAQHGIATVSIDAQSHGLPLDASLRRVFSNLLASHCLSGLGDALQHDRARDLNGDGTADSAGLTFSAYMFHTRDALRQSALDFLMAIRIVRSFQGAEGAPPNRPWDPSSVPFGPDTLSFSGDVDGDGQANVAGDFDGNGVPDFGGFEPPNRMWGSSLGGIITMLVTGVEPSIAAAAPVSGGGGLFDLGLRTDLGTARNPIWLRVMGPILTSVTSGGPGPETSCAAGRRSLRFEVPDLSDLVRVEIACLDGPDLDQGDAVVLRNLASGEQHCAPVVAGGVFRTQVASDEGDRLEIRIHHGGASTLDARDCTFRVPAGTAQPEPTQVVRTWQVAHACVHCAHYQQQVYENGEPLVSPIEGLGLARQTPALRRLASLAQIALDPADPVNYARRVFLAPPSAIDVTARTRSILVTATVGDATVPVSAAEAYARAAGIIAFLPPDAPDAFADHRAPAEFLAARGLASPEDLLIARFVPEALSRLDRFPIPGAPGFLFDVDDFSEGRQFFAPDGSHQILPADGGVRPMRESVPLRWARESRRASASSDLWNGASAFEGHSAMVHAMTVPHGQHVVLPIDPNKIWDDGRYFVNLIGWYLASQGSDLPYLSRPTEHDCLEQNTCFWPE